MRPLESYSRSPNPNSFKTLPPLTLAGGSSISMALAPRSVVARASLLRILFRGLWPRLATPLRSSHDGSAPRAGTPCRLACRPPDPHRLRLRWHCSKLDWCKFG